MAELSRLGRYELRRVLGKGAMGVVYEGFDPTLDRSVAVKTILKSMVIDVETERAYSARFAREARAVGRLNHPNIVQVYDFGEQGDVAYIVMEFIEGRELRDFFEAREEFETGEAVRIMGELLDALEFAHEAGVIHRDVKPANVMLDAQRRVKLADFGVARIQDGSDRSKGGTLVGTPAFMSPEQISGSKVDRRTDLFSAGIVLYQLLTGEPPFKGEGAWTVARTIMQDEPPRPSTVAVSVSPLFDAIVNRALAKKPDQRFASAKEFSIALQGALAGDSAAGAQRGSDAEIEFWRSIQNSNDAAEFEVYLKEFPAGIYADLARIKMAKLPRIAPGAGSVTPAPAPPPAARDTREVLKLVEEKARLEAEIARREAEFRKHEAEAEARRQAEEKARFEADARREAEAAARAAAEERARLTAIEKAKQEAKAELARRETEYRKREAEAAARAEAEAKARRAAEEKARKDAEAKAREARARQKAEAEARVEAGARANAKARQDAEQQARRDARLAKREAELRKREAAGPQKKAPLVQILIAVMVVVAGAIGAHYWAISSDEARVAALTAALDAATKATQELNLARQRQEELQKQVELARLAEDDARAKGDQEKLKELQEQTKRAEADARKQDELVKQREAAAKKTEDAAKLAEARKQTDAAKAASEKAMQEKIAQEKTAQEKIAQEKAAAEKLAAEKAAAEKASAVKAAAEKLAAEKAAAPAKAPPVSVAAVAPGAAPRAAPPPSEGMAPGRYAFRLMGDGVCIDVQEDIEVRAGSSQSISGREFSNLRFRSAQDGSIAATAYVWTRRYNGDAKLTGRATDTGYAGSYEWGAGMAMTICTGKWTLVRKGN